MDTKDKFIEMNVESTYGMVDGQKPPDTNDLADQVKKLQERVDYLMEKRITQVDFVPGSVRTRSMGEANLWVRGGLEANLPTAGEGTTNGYALYFCTDSKKLKIWTGTAWVSTTLA